jgi:hypothetical protein
MQPIKETTGFGNIEESPDNALLQLGIQLRALFTSNLFTSKQGCEYCAWQASQGMQVRSSPQLPMRSIIFEGQWSWQSIRAICRRVWLFITARQ